MVLTHAEEGLKKTLSLITEVNFTADYMMKAVSRKFTNCWSRKDLACTGFLNRTIVADALYSQISRTCARICSKANLGVPWTCLD